MDDAGVEKLPNPHNFRHYFVTACKRDYGMDESTIKHLIGHGPENKVMETTYQHLTGDDHIRVAEVAADLRELEEESPLTPQVCPMCGEQLDPEAKACPGCRTVFAPDAKAAEDQMQDDMKQSYKETDPDDEETMDALDALEEPLKDAKQDPEKLDEIIEVLGKRD